MLLFLSMLDTDEDRSKFVQLYHKYRYFLWYLAQESYERILQAVRQLDEIYRVVFEYKYLHELSDREIADLLGVTPKVVNVRIFRARKKLQNLLREE